MNFKNFKILEKVNITTIVKNHLSTLRNHSSKKVGFDDYFTFLILPLLGASILIWNGIFIDIDYSRLIVTCLSILVGLLLNVNVLVFNIAKREKDNNLKTDIIKQIFSNISFAILLSVFGIITVLVTGINQLILKYVIHFIVYFLLIEFFLTLLMVLKRMYILFSYELDN